MPHRCDRTWPPARPLPVPMLLGEGLPQHRRALLRGFLQEWQRRDRLLPSMTASASSESARELAARVWSFRLASELEAAQRFGALSPLLRAAGASEVVAGMAQIGRASCREGV